MNWPTPVPKMDSARPVTFWFARSVMVRKLKISEAIAPARKAKKMPTRMVEVAGLFRQDLAERTEQQRRAVGDGGDDEGDK